MHYMYSYTRIRSQNRFDFHSNVVNISEHIVPRNKLYQIVLSGTKIILFFSKMITGLLYFWIVSDKKTGRCVQTNETTFTQCRMLITTGKQNGHKLMFLIVLDKISPKDWTNDWYRTND